MTKKYTHVFLKKISHATSGLKRTVTSEVFPDVDRWRVDAGFCVRLQSPYPDPAPLA